MPGMEAAPVRKGLFAIVLVAAAFAGGAAVNGPGLRWAQAMILNQSPTGGEDDESPPLTPPTVGEATGSETDPSAPTSPDPESASSGSDPAPSKEPGETVPTSRDRLSATPQSGAPQSPNEPKAPEPSEIAAPATEPEVGGDEKTSGDDPATSETKPPSPLDGLPPLEVPGGQPAKNTAASPGSPSKSDDPSSAGLPPPVEEAKPAPADAPEQARPAPRRQAPAQQAWADVPGSAPAAAVPPKGYEPPARRDPAAKTAAARTEGSAGVVDEAEDEAASSSEPGRSQTAGDWSEIRRRMRALGVARYGIEGEPGGRVRFHCVIPLAGRRAVGQQFEAEGDDEFQAAQAALRRVALWRATENTGP
jgi:hypothetical protein